MADLSLDMPYAKEAKTMKRNGWVVALLALVWVSMLGMFPVGALALTAGQCEVFGRRGLIDDATRQACCREHNMACPEGTQGGFGGGASQSQGFGGAANVGASVAGGAVAGAGNSGANGAGQAQSVVDALGVFGGGANPPQGSNAPRGWSGDRNVNSKTPEQVYATKKYPYFFEDKSKYPQ